MTSAHTRRAFSSKSLRVIVVAMIVKPDRKEAILQAMLELVVERGINDAPMSQLAKRSGASPGIIYHYFPSKDDILTQLYYSIKARMLNSLAVHIDSSMPLREAFLQVWQNAYDFYRSHPNETKFLSQYENLPCYSQDNKPSTMMEDPNYLLLANFFKSKKEGGLLKELPLEILAELTVGVAGRIAKHPNEYPINVLQQVAAICYESVVERD
ncbi:MAG: hypothetical protein DKT66_13915 [Candidatus Melainabacteria bacterium]|nr:MAG: hypothetical protein DKT66_13915 [Candidatus Melainabacteria bacterium]